MATTATTDFQADNRTKAEAMAQVLADVAMLRSKVMSGQNINQLAVDLADQAAHVLAMGEEREYVKRVMRTYEEMLITALVPSGEEEGFFLVAGTNARDEGPLMVRSIEVEMMDGKFVQFRAFSRDAILSTAKDKFSLTVVEVLADLLSSNNQTDLAKQVRENRRVSMRDLSRICTEHFGEPLRPATINSVCREGLHLNIERSGAGYELLIDERVKKLLLGCNFVSDFAFSPADNGAVGDGE